MADLCIKGGDNIFTKGRRPRPDRTKINEGIRAKEVRVVDETGGQAGVMSLTEALKLAREKGMDLIEITETAVPPVCRIGDYGKYKYELEKKKRDMRKKQKGVEIKEIKIRPQIGEHDFQTKLKHIREFLEEGDKVKITIVFKGREISHQELGERLLNRLGEELKGLFVVEQQPRREGMSRITILAPVKK